MPQRLLFTSIMLMTLTVNVSGEDLVTPKMTELPPAAGRRVRMVAPEYKDTAVYHALYLPTNWSAEHTYPVVVEYTGNQFAACGSTGEVKDAHLGYGLTSGKDFIWVSMPYIEVGGKENALLWWGDRQATIDYCKRNLSRIWKEFGGDPNRTFLCGFSRGALATSYIGLADDEIAAFWKGFITHDHFDGERTWNYPLCDRQSALKRLHRLQGRPVLVCGGGNDFLKDHLDLADFTFLRPPIADLFDIPEAGVIHPHTDLWMHRESKWQKKARNWLLRHSNEKNCP